MPPARRPLLRAWVPVVLALIIQLASTALALHATQPAFLHHMRSPAGASAYASFGSRAQLPAAPWLTATGIALAVLGPAVLVAVRRAPRTALLIITSAAVGGTALFASQGFDAPFYVSVLFGVAAAAYRRARIWAWACAGAYWLGFALTSLISGDVLQLGWLVPLTLLSVAALVGPEFGRSRREARTRALRDAEARRAEETQAERVRIARELHDVLAHSLSQINVQASVGLHLFGSQPGKAEEALASIKDTSKQALGEVRQVLGMLRGDEVPLAPEHELDGIRSLVDGVRTQGIDASLRFEVTDASRLSAPVQQAAYRIVQEALTNVTRHAGATRVEVVVARVDRAAGARLRLTVRDDGIGATSAKSSPHGAASSGAIPHEVATDSARVGGAGRGLLGMRERAELLGGTFSAGPRAGGGFEVVAELPLGGAS